MSDILSFYLHGLGKDVLRPQEKRLLDRQRKLGLTVVDAYIDWRSSETFLSLCDRIAEEAHELLSPMNADGKLILNGTSAGVCLALAVRRQLDDSRVRVIGHSGRVRRGFQAKWDLRSLERCAHLGTDEESRAFYEGVQYCEEEVIPSLTTDQKGKTLLTTPFAGIDELVPGSTMPIEGVRNIVMTAVGHVWTIGQGMYRMPELVQQLP